MSLLFKRHFQTAYIVDDARAAVAMLSACFGVTKWEVMDMLTLHGPEAPATVICNAWVGDMMIELIEPNPATPSIYRDWKVSDDAPLRLHHLGFLVDSEDDLSAAKAHLVDQGFPLVMAGSFGDVLDFAYLDTRSALGHYYEIIWLKAEGESFFGGIPVN